MRKVLILLLISIFLVGCQTKGIVKEEPKEEGEMEKHSEDITKERAIKLAVKYLKKQDWSKNFYKKPLSIDEFETFWDIFFEEKGEHGKPGKCLIRVYKLTGEVKEIILR